MAPRDDVRRMGSSFVLRELLIVVVVVVVARARARSLNKKKILSENFYDIVNKNF